MSSEDKGGVITLSFRIKSELTDLQESPDTNTDSDVRIVKRRFHIQTHTLRHLLHFLASLYCAHITVDTEPAVDIRFNYPRLSFSSQSGEELLAKTLQEAEVTADSVVWVHVH